jgi:hypothetical protein
VNELFSSAPFETAIFIKSFLQHKTEAVNALAWIQDFASSNIASTFWSEIKLTFPIGLAPGVW